MANSSNIRLMCPNLKCRAVLSVPGTARGRLVRCKNCGASIRVPQPKTAPTTPAEPVQEGEGGTPGQAA
jgi:RNase P subunit RPR2